MIQLKQLVIKGVYKCLHQCIHTRVLKFYIQEKLQHPNQAMERMKLLKPAGDKVKDLPGNMVENAAEANVQLTVEALKVSNPVLAEKVQQGKLQIKGAYYRLDIGLVEIFQ